MCGFPHPLSGVEICTPSFTRYQDVVTGAELWPACLPSYNRSSGEQGCHWNRQICGLGAVWSPTALVDCWKYYWYNGRRLSEAYNCLQRSSKYGSMDDLSDWKLFERHMYM